MKKQQEELQKEMADLTSKGEYMKIFTAMKDQAGKTKRAINLENARFMALHGQVIDTRLAQMSLPPP